MNKDIMAFILNTLSMISQFNEVVSFSFEKNELKIKVKPGNMEDAEWRYLNRSADEDVTQVIKIFKIEKTGDYATIFIIFND